MSVTAVQGFEAGGIASGIKASGAPDLAMVATTDRRPVTAAGVFTTNLVAAAPVQLSQRHLVDGRAAAVILNSGNANAATGDAGRADALRMCELTAASVGCATADVLVCQTGLIGIPMPMAPVEAGIPKLGAQLSADPTGGLAAADAMLTTDTVRKQTLVELDLVGTSSPGITVSVGGMAKGAAMLAPAMATMLAVLTTDAAVEPDALQVLLQDAVAGSFNALVVDACTSTNDTVLVLANGAAGNEVITRDSGPAFHLLGEALAAACADLARQMAADAEGATKLVTLTVRNARTREDAQRAARKVASSQLVQCSLYGQDPYWGRVLSELGVSGAWFDPERVDIAYQGITVCRDGIASEHDAPALAARMTERDIEIVCDLGTDGHGEATMLFTDLTHAYVDENMGTS
ncbi:MAG TPA: bifunctional glutamate N-acetyltransferase/amino-acid acetyltransferase ArgJ [Acidimicrobiia bacterium]|nr:bifunctional glutamate N-acetyltransferase/amino-acid acetyltransferase ArgJ [Acidimicrobiia bacterium]